MGRRPTDSGVRLLQFPQDGTLYGLFFTLAFQLLVSLQQVVSLIAMQPLVPFEIPRPLEGASAFFASQVAVDDPFRRCVDFLAMNLQPSVVDKVLPASHASRVGLAADDGS